MFLWTGMERKTDFLSSSLTAEDQLNFIFLKEINFASHQKE